MEFSLILVFPDLGSEIIFSATEIYAEILETNFLVQLTRMYLLQNYRFKILPWIYNSAFPAFTKICSGNTLITHEVFNYQDFIHFKPV